LSYLPVFKYTQRMDITTLFIDLDDTVYPHTSGIWDAIKIRIDAYIREKIPIPAEEIPAVRKRYFETYGTTLRGLQANFAIDPQDYLSYVHDVPIESILKPDPALKNILTSLPQRKFILTNADSRHARRVLKAAQIEDCFEEIIDIFAIAPYCKPMPESFLKALQISGESDPARCMLLDDANLNISAARKLGFYTARVGGEPGPSEAHWQINSLHELPAILNLKPL